MNKLKLLLCSFALVVLAGCSTQSTTKTADKKLNVVATTTFINDTVKTIAQDKVNVYNIISVGKDPHLFEAKASDLEEINKADLVLYSGLHLEAKMTDVLKKAATDKRKVVAVTKDLAQNEILKMEEDNVEVIDPHFWFDVDLYKKSVKVVSEELQAADAKNAELYKKNTEAYLKELDTLKTESKAKIAEIPKESRYLITPHDAFQYFSRANDIEVKALQGVSTDSEIGTNDVIDLVNFIYNNKVKAIFVESTTPHKNIEAVQSALKAKNFEVKLGEELYSDSLSDKEHGADTYIKMYKHNIDAMVSGLK